MVDSIVPIAVSSQLDDSGEERIHIANTIAGGVNRPEFLPSISGNAPDGVVGDSISYTYTVVASGPYVVTLDSGALPTGLSLSTSGVLTGTFTVDGNYSWVVKVTDVNNNTATVADSATVSSGIVTLTTLATGVPGGATVIAWSPDSIYCAITSNTSPFLHVYKRTGDTFANLTLPSTGMSSRGQGLRWSADGLQLAVAPEASVTPFILRRSGDTFTKEALADQNPGKQERGFTYNPAGTRLALTYEDKMFDWAVTSGVYTAGGLKITFSAANTRSNQASSYSADSQLFATGLSTSPWIDVHSISGDVYTLITPPPAVPASSVFQPRFSPDSKFLAWAHNVSPYYSLYSRDLTTNAFTAIVGLPAADASPVCFEWSPTGANFATGGAGTNMKVFKRNGTTVTLQATLASSSTTTAIAWSPNGNYIAAGASASTIFVKVT